MTTLTWNRRNQMTTLRTAAQQALEALELAQTDVHWELNSPTRKFLRKAEKTLRAALAQEQAEPVAEIIEPQIKVDSHQTLDDAMRLPRAMAQAYESGYKAGAAAERKRIIQFLTEMQRQVGDGHNHYGVAAMRIRERV